MISFECDYNNGAHPKVLQHLVENNDARTTPYGFDEFSNRAKALISNACELSDAQIFLLTGGTQTNATVISSILQQHEGVVCVDSGHINVHEAGAIEFTGHKVIALPGEDGKMKPQVLEKYLNDFENDTANTHIVFPGLVYISFPTEFGTLYSRQELSDLYQVCQHHDIPLYIDGARLGYGLMAEGCDISLPYLARHCDVFYIGGTKAGALCGEAVVFTHQNAHKHFFTIQKQHGAVIAKGALIGMQFEALFTDNLYFEISRHAIEMAMRMKQIFLQRGYKLYTNSPTNQQFIIISNDKVEQLIHKVEFSLWGPADDNNTICRFVTHWATTNDDLRILEEILDSINS